jgi:hypothetical protein
VRRIDKVKNELSTGRNIINNNSKTKDSSSVSQRLDLDQTGSNKKRTRSSNSKSGISSHKKLKKNSRPTSLLSGRPLSGTANFNNETPNLGKITSTHRNTDKERSLSRKSYTPFSPKSATSNKNNVIQKDSVALKAKKKLKSLKDKK